MSTSRITSSTARKIGLPAVVVAPFMLKGTPCHVGQLVLLRPAELLGAAVCAVAVPVDELGLAALDPGMTQDQRSGLVLGVAMAWKEALEEAHSAVVEATAIADPAAAAAAMLAAAEGLAAGAAEPVRSLALNRLRRDGYGLLRGVALAPMPAMVAAARWPAVDIRARLAVRVADRDLQPGEIARGVAAPDALMPLMTMDAEAVAPADLLAVNDALAEDAAGLMLHGLGAAAPWVPSHAAQVAQGRVHVTVAAPPRAPTRQVITRRDADGEALEIETRPIH